MKKQIYLCMAGFFWLVACNQNQPDQSVATNKSVAAGPASPVVAKQGNIQPDEIQCAAGERLLYQDAGFSSYTEDKIRGTGVVSFTLDINDRLNILGMDGSAFGEIVLNEDMSYFTLNMPEKTLARNVVTHFDFAAFDFDAEDANTDKEYLIIYVNKEKRKVKKSDLKFTFNKWQDYLENNRIMLKTCNSLEDASGKRFKESRDQAFVIIDIKGDRIKIKSVEDCISDGVEYKPMQGWVKWKSNDELLIDFTTCN